MFRLVRRISRFYNIATNEELEKRIASLEDWIRRLVEQSASNTSQSFMHNAEYLALYEAVINIAASIGPISSLVSKT